MKRLGLVLVVVLTSCNTLSAAERRYAFEQTELKNGMEVLSLEDFSCPIVAVQVWYHVGSKNEEPGRQGFAHMFEHMMFRGTDRLSETGHFDHVRRVGGDCNAYTAFDQTVYVEELPSDQIELALWLEAERMAFLKIDKKGFETERKVVEEELRMGHNRPYGRVPEKLLDGVFSDHCYGWTPGGQISHLRRAKVEEVSAFWDKYYAPNNATLVVVGAVKHADVQALAKKYFEWIPACPQPDHPECSVESPKKPRTLRLKEDKGPLPIVGVVYYGVPENHVDALPLEILMGALGGGESSRLYVDIVKDKKIAQVAVGGAFGFEKAGLVGAGGVLLPLGDKKELMKTIKRHIMDVRENGLTQAELDKMKNQLRRREVDGALTVASKARLLGTYAVIDGDAERINRRLDEIDRVTLADVKRVAAQYLAKDTHINVSIEPDAGGILGNLLGAKKDKADDPDQVPPVEDDGANRPAPRTGPKAAAKRPDGFPPKPPIGPMLDEFEIAGSEEKTLANGLRVVVVANHEVPMVTMMLGLKRGAWSEAKPGAASMAMSMLTQGTTSHDSKQLAETLESHAIHLNGSAGMDTARLNASALVSELDLAAELFYDVLANPTFPKEEFGILMKQQRMSLLVSTRTPEYLAERELRRRLYGEHPYSRTVSGELEDLENLTLDDLKQWWSRNVRPENAVLYFAGDIAGEKAFKLAEKSLGKWQARTPDAEPHMADIPAPSTTHIYLVDRPGSVQSQIRVGQLGIRRGHPLYFVSRVFSNVFGGGFNSRLNKAIRVDKGLTYGARGGMTPNRFAGEMRISTFTKTPTTAETVKVILEEIKKIQSEPPTKDEVLDTQTYLTGAFPGDRETPQAVVGDLWMIETEDLPSDYLRRYISGIKSSTPADVLSAAKELIDPKKLVIVVVGEAKSIQDDLEKIAPVTVVRAAAPSEEKKEEDKAARKPEGDDARG